MSIVQGIQRDDPGYMAVLEDKCVRLRASEQEKIKSVKEEQTSPDASTLMQALQDITDRLGRLESWPNTSTDTASSLGANAASLIAGPPTKALSKLSGEEEEGGMCLRPETYAQAEPKEKNRDCNKLDMISLFYGWISVADYLIRKRGDVASYINHVKYAAEMLNSRQFYDSGAIKYDRLIIDKYVNGKATNFNPVPVASILAFSSRVIPDSVEMCPGGSITKGHKQTH